MSLHTEESQNVNPMDTSEITEKSDMEETGTNNTKVSDSAYSNSCSNSQSQRSGSSKSRHSTSSGSSGYCGHPSTASSSNKAFPQPSSVTKRNKDHKKKKLKISTNNECSNNTRTIINEHHNDSNNNAGTPTTDSPVDSPPNNNNTPTIDDTELQFNNITTPTKDSEALQIAVLSQTFSCIKKLKNKDISPDETEVGKSHVVNIDDNQQQQIINSLKTDANYESEFCAVVSMQDGIVLYTTPSINDVLGFPVDMWVGRSLIDFVHPKDRIAFASNISTGISNPQLEYNNKHGNTEETSSKCHSFFCCLRRYRGLNMNGFGVTEKKVSYLPCQLTTRFKEVKLNHQENSPHCIFLVVTAQAASSAYKFPDETKMTPKFMTQHSATSHLTHVDPDVVPYFGFLPQDMLGRSVFDFYHPEDLVYIKEVYEAVMKEQGQPICSKPYRFRCQNGCYVLLETEWSNFINPWTRKLMFVIGQHRVLKGPSNPDVLTPVEVEETLEISEEILKESKTIQEQIKTLLSETVVRNSEKSKRQESTCCKDLASFMETLMDEFTKPADLKLDLANEVQFVSERDSVMLGEISPHSDYYESKYSSETPPSYNQLNYNENIQRFFESKPKTSLSDGSRENKNNTNPSSMSGGDEEEKSSAAVNFGSTSHNNRLCMKTDLEQQEKSELPDCRFEGKNENGENGHSSGSGLSSASAGNLDSHESRGETSVTDTSNISSYKPLHLTEALLYKHNEDMEKQMVQKHREQRGKPDRRSRHKGGRHKSGFDKIQEEQCCHGIKRSGSHSWEGEPYKSIKQTHGNIPTTTDVSGEQSQCTHNAMYNAQHMPNTVPQRPVYQPPPVNHNVNQWPPFSVIVTPLHPSQSCSSHMNYTTPLVNPMMPVYYMEPMSSSSNLNGNSSHYRAPNPSEHPGPPNPQQPSHNLQQNTYIRHQVQYSSNMMYQPLAIPLFGPQPVMYAPSAGIPIPTQMTQPTQIPRSSRPFFNSNSQQTSAGKPAVQVFRPSSQATSVKAEPGSALCSVASASLKQVMSESSKKAAKSVCSPGGLTSCTISSTEKHKECNMEADAYSCDVDGSYNSLYSFLKTEQSDDSMKSSIINHHSPPHMDMMWEKSEDISMEAERPWPLRKEPPWLEDIKVTPELVFRYQISESREIDEILKRDLQVLDSFHQPCMVNEQLSQLYLDLEGLSKHLTLEEGILSSSGSSGEDNGTCVSYQKTKQKKTKFLGYDRMAMIFEESAPLPPPENIILEVQSS